MSTVVAKTAAAGGPSLDAKVLAFSSSLPLDRQLFKEDLLGSLAHVRQLLAAKLISLEDARALHHGLCALWTRGHESLPNEEDVHMAVEAALLSDIGAPSRVLHTARSRNDQVATDLRLHVREQCARTLETLASLIGQLKARAQADSEVVLPGYTHRQRAQPISAAYWWASWAEGFARDADTFAHALEQADALALGVGALTGTSLGIDRETARAALGFSRLTANGLDTVGDRDFALDYLYAITRLFVRIGRLSADVIDFATQEFGFISLDGEIACGSSMMPHKRNPDVFELLRGRSGIAIGALTGLLATVKGLPGGYSRDLQEDRGPLLDASAKLAQSLDVLQFALGHIRFVPEKTRAAVEEGATQATDLAEVLVKKGVAFRDAYMAVGALVRMSRDRGVALSSLTLADAKGIDPRFDAEALAVLEPKGSVARKESPGGTGPKAIAFELENLTARIAAIKAKAAAAPRIDSLFEKLKGSAP